MMRPSSSVKLSSHTVTYYDSVCTGKWY